MLSSLIFFGSDRFSAVVLKELITHYPSPITHVVTDPPAAVGRKRILTPNPVEILAKTHKLKVLYYTANNEELINFIKQHKSVGLSASFPHLFPPQLIQLFNNQLYNLHPSLLPQYRNVAPGPYAISMGDKETGITLQHIDEKIDHGNIVAQVTEPIYRPTDLSAESSAKADTTTTLLTRLFTMGTQLFLKFLNDPNYPNLTADLPVMSSSELIFTRKLTRESGYVEWKMIQTLLRGYALKVGESKNPLINLRLTHHPERTKNILPDLIRALESYEKVWTTAPTKKGDLNITINLSSSDKYGYNILIPGKPKPISYTDFSHYYL